MNGTDPFCLCRGIIFNLDALSCLIDTVAQILRTCGTGLFQSFFLSLPLFMKKEEKNTEKNDGPLKSQQKY